MTQDGGRCRIRITAFISAFQGCTHCKVLSNTPLALTALLPCPVFSSAPPDPFPAAPDPAPDPSSLFPPETSYAETRVTVTAYTQGVQTRWNRHDARFRLWRHKQNSFSKVSAKIIQPKCCSLVTNIATDCMYTNIPGVWQVYRRVPFCPPPVCRFAPAAPARDWSAAPDPDRTEAGRHTTCRLVETGKADCAIPTQ